MNHTTRLIRVSLWELCCLDSTCSCLFNFRCVACCHITSLYHLLQPSLSHLAGSPTTCPQSSPPLPPAEDVVHLCTGIRPIGVFCLTLICIFYEFCLFGHIFFKDRFGISQGLDLDHVVQFDTLEDSFLTMFQARGPRLPLACPALAPRSNPLMLLSNPFVLLSTLSCCFRPVSCCFRPDACCFTSLSRSTNQNIVRYQ